MEDYVAKIFTTDKCKECGILFDRRKGCIGYHYNNDKFCSYACYNKYLKRLDDEFRQKHEKDFIGER